MNTAQTTIHDEDARTMTDLLPCPFCGAPAQRCDVPADIEDENAGASYIECSRCAVCTALHFDRKENLDRSWNDRAQPLWCAHVRGPDDVIACINYDAAVKLCDEINAVAKTAAVLDVMCVAYPAVWPWSAQDHAADLARDNGYRKAVITPTSEKTDD